MKAILIFWFLVFSNGIFSQDLKNINFHFNEIYYYIKEYNNVKKDIFIYINSENPDYYLVVNKQDNMFFGDLRFLKNHKNYFFKVSNSNGNNKFELFNSASFINLTSGIDYYNIVEKSLNNYELIIYKNNKRKKIICKHFLETEISKKALFNLYSIALKYPLDDESDLFSNEKILVKKASIEKDEKIQSIIYLKEMKNIDLSIEVPTDF